MAVKRGQFIKCPRCRMTGRLDGFMNHRNGETHCYLCDGRGLSYRMTSEEKALETERQQAFQGLHFASMHGPRKLNTPTAFMRACRTAEYPGRGPEVTEEAMAAYQAQREADRANEQRVQRLANFWIKDCAASVMADWKAELDAHKTVAWQQAKHKLEEEVAA